MGGGGGALLIIEPCWFKSDPVPQKRGVKDHVAQPVAAVSSDEHRTLRGGSAEAPCARAASTHRTSDPRHGMFSQNIHIRAQHHLCHPPPQAQDSNTHSVKDKNAAMMRLINQSPLRLKEEAASTALPLMTTRGSSSGSAPQTPRLKYTSLHPDKKLFWSLEIIKA